MKKHFNNLSGDSSQCEQSRFNCLINYHRKRLKKDIKRSYEFKKRGFNIVADFMCPTQN